MIRKAIIVVLTLGAAGLCILDIVSTAGFPHRQSCGLPDSFCFPPPSCPRLKLYSAIGADQACDLEVLVWHHMIYFKHNTRRGKHSAGFQLIDNAVWWLVSGVPFARFSLPGYTEGGACWRRARLSLWMPVTLLVSYPFIAFIRGPLRRWRRRLRGLCIRCAYNLEGNVSGVCPECGEAR